MAGRAQAGMCLVALQKSKELKTANVDIVRKEHRRHSIGNKETKPWGLNMECTSKKTTGVRTLNCYGLRSDDKFEI